MCNSQLPFALPWHGQWVAGDAVLVVTHRQGTASPIKLTGTSPSGRPRLKLMAVGTLQLNEGVVSIARSLVSPAVLCRNSLQLHPAAAAWEDLSRLHVQGMVKGDP